jgi:hypothetical protein
VGARPGANRQRQDRRHRRSRQPADRRVRRFGGGQAGQADMQLGDGTGSNLAAQNPN